MRLSSLILISFSPRYAFRHYFTLSLFTLLLRFDY
jgi:hypothetical protein